MAFGDRILGQDVFPNKVPGDGVHGELLFANGFRRAAFERMVAGALNGQAAIKGKMI